jgi:hypothetical protein
MFAISDNNIVDSTNIDCSSKEDDDENLEEDKEDEE